MTMAAINVFSTGSFLFSKYRIENSMTTVIKKSIPMPTMGLSVISNKSESENKSMKPAPIETRFIKKESRKALPALLYFIMIIVTASSTMVTIMKMIITPNIRPGAAASSK
jgi:hypothetical protein